jgi:hypothetical protein
MNPTAAIAAIRNAQTEWTGKTWTSAPDELLASLEKDKPDPDVTGGTWWESDGSQHAGLLRKTWHDLLQDVRRYRDDGEGELEDLIFGAEEMVEEENQYVEGRASEASEYGDLAVECLNAGDWTGAIDHLEKACAIEREFGDDPTWVVPYNEVVDLIEASEDGETLDGECGESAHIRAAMA